MGEGEGRAWGGFAKKKGQGGLKKKTRTTDAGFGPGNAEQIGEGGETKKKGTLLNSRVHLSLDGNKAKIYRRWQRGYRRNGKKLPNDHRSEQTRGCIGNRRGLVRGR